MSLKSLGILILFAILSGILPGCSPDEPCRDPMGCVELASGQSLTIGAAVPLTGPNRPAGEAALAALLDTAAQKAKINGYPIRIQKVDFDCPNDNAAVVAERLTGESSLVGVIASACLLTPSKASGASAAAIAFSQAGAVVLAPSSDPAPVTGDPGVLGLHPSNGAWEGAIDPRFATQAAGLFFKAVEATATLRSDGSLLVPRQALQNKLLDLIRDRSAE